MLDNLSSRLDDADVLPFAATTRRVVFDAGLAMILMVLGFGGAFTIGAVDPEEHLRSSDFLHGALIALMTLPLAARRIFPIPVVAVVLIAWSIDRAFDYPSTLAAGAILLGFHAIGTELPRQAALAIGGAMALLIVGWTAVGTLTLTSVPATATMVQVLATAIPLWLGMEIHERRRRVSELQDKVEQAKRQQTTQAARAVAEERVRIARELHDVVAHQITVIMLQADGARRIVNDGDMRVAHALDTVTETSRSALNEMRRMVGLLRSPDAAATYALSSSAPLSPLPKIDDIDDLISRVRSAGLAVEISFLGERVVLDDGAEVSAFRVVQEALTNVMRHAGPDAEARVVFDYGEESLVLFVEDTGLGFAENSIFGHGLVGLRERVTMLGGDLTVGLGPAGGVRIEAVIPYEAA